jgi:hypothetical protein
MPDVLRGDRYSVVNTNRGNKGVDYKTKRQVGSFYVRGRGGGGGGRHQCDAASAIPG